MRLRVCVHLREMMHCAISDAFAGAGERGGQEGTRAERGGRWSGGR